MSDIKVKAVKPGLYGGAYRKVGDVFLIASKDDFSKRWMEMEDRSPVQETSQEAQKAYRENATAELDNLGNALAGNPSAAPEGPASSASNFDGMDDDALAAYYGEIIGEKPGNMKRETMIKRISDKLNAD
ncbi:hypothetical protein [Paracoccus shanxieyensis]|uniref:Uncharacterized protein n=1 Tax=Paracoccus shanxieyensis TaxID=2675752 RepID=A0A6L6J0Y0_9RHOB|nr:hypothetical protein [Paracoccus shanxieyensis]MTH65072.1 hypothetical protein [Paracoccus shanxieyensis]MTH88216.1 hypothetical protein [Paracoccus shanxieyensis]